MSDELDIKACGLIITRRNALQALGLAGIGVISLGRTDTAFGQEIGQPVKGGTLSIRISGDPPNFDMFSNSTLWSLATIAACYNSLVKFSPADPMKVVGDLATEWKLGDDGRSITFKLVKDARFHDGVPLTSADVKYTFDIARDPPEGTVSARKILLSAIETIDAVDEYTVRFNLKRPCPSLITTLATGWFVVAPKHILEAKGNMKEDVVGSGPYKFQQYTRGVSVELVRNPAYHVSDRPHLDGITFFIVPEASTAFSYLASGQVHIYDEIPSNYAKQAESEMRDLIKIHKKASYVGDPYTVNTRRKPFDDVRVRKALAMSINHAQAVQVVNAGDGELGGLLPSSPWGMAPGDLAGMPGYSPDVEKSRAVARELLADAGYSNGFDAKMVVRRGAGTHEARAIFLADQFAKIGVRLTLDLQESAAYFEKMQKHDFEIATNTVTSLANDPDFLLGDFHTTGGSLNYGGLSSKVIDDLFIAQSQEVDMAKRADLVHQLEKAIMEEYVTVILYFKNKYTGTSTRLQNYTMHPEPDNNRRMEDVWLTA